MLFPAKISICTLIRLPEESCTVKVHLSHTSPTAQWCCQYPPDQSIHFCLHILPPQHHSYLSNQMRISKVVHNKHLRKKKKKHAHTHYTSSDYLTFLGLRLWREGLTDSLVPVRELPPRPLMVAGCTTAKVARDAMALVPQLTGHHSSC